MSLRRIDVMVSLGTRNTEIVKHTHIKNSYGLAPNQTLTIVLAFGTPWTLRKSYIQLKKTRLCSS